MSLVSIYEQLTLHIPGALQGPLRWSPPAYYWRLPWCRSATGPTSLEAVKPWGGKECHSEMQLRIDMWAVHQTPVHPEAPRSCITSIKDPYIMQKKHYLTMIYQEEAAEGTETRLLCGLQGPSPPYQTALLDMDTSGVIKEWDCHLPFPF